MNSAELQLCEVCQTMKHTRTAVVRGHYYKDICSRCIGAGDDQLSSGVASYERRRGYEDNAQDTIQPYDALGNPNPEFLRLYPLQAKRMYSQQVIDELKRQI